MIGTGVSKRYARALFQLGTEGKQVEPIGRALNDVAAAMASSAELRTVFEDPKNAPETKRKVIQAIAQKAGAPPMLVNALAMLADRNRLMHVQGIADAYQAMAEQAAGRLRAEVISATPLPDAYYRELEKTLSEATGRQVTLVKRQDPTLIGGVVTRVGDTVFDGSIKNRLRDIRHQMLVASSTPLPRA